MFLYDIGVTPFEEPFKKLVHQGMITKDGVKMSKSIGNVVNPDDYDSDEMRMYLMQIGPYEQGGDWNDSAIKGVRKFIGRINRMLDEATEDGEIIDMTDFITEINRNMETFKVNLVVSNFMKFYNTNKSKTINIETANEIRELISCFAPKFETK